MAKRTMFWCFTLNNPLTEDIPKPAGMTYLVYQLEKGASGTPHLQGYVEFATGKLLSSLKTWLTGAHFEPRRGTAQQAADYCRKAEGRIKGPWEFGAMSLPQGTRSDLAEFVAAIRRESTDSELMDAYPEQFFKHCKVIDRVRNSIVQETRPRRVVVCLGPSGTGKTKYARGLGTFNADLCVLPVSKDMWFDGCHCARVCVLDDFAGEMPLVTLLRLLHEHPEKVAIKGGFATWNPDIVVITTNIRPGLWYDFSGRKEHEVALNRRFNQLLWFGDSASFAGLSALPGCSAQWEQWSPLPPLPAAGSSAPEQALVAGQKRKRELERRPYKIGPGGVPVRHTAPAMERKRVTLLDVLDSDEEDTIVIED